MRAKRFRWLTSALPRNPYFKFRAIVAAIVLVAVLTYTFWFVMLPIFLLAGLVAAYLRYSRPKDSL